VVPQRIPDPLRRGSALATLCLLAVLAAFRPAAAQTTALQLDSQPGDFIGGAQQRTLTPAVATFAGSTSADHSRVTITLSGADFSNSWNTVFAAPAGSPLVPGVYENATRFPLQNYGLDVFGAGRGCNRLVGRFVVYEAVIESDGTVTRFAADFEQHCELISPALFGAIRFNSTRSSLVPFDGVYPAYSLRVQPAVNGYVTGPGISCGAGGRTDCEAPYDPDTVIALQAVPSPGYVFLGWAGLDCVGDQNLAIAITRRKFCAPVFNVAPGGAGPESPDYSSGAFFLDGTLGTGEPSVAAARIRQVYVNSGPDAFTLSALSFTRATGTEVELQIDGPRSARWNVTFGAAPGGTLSPGSYEFAANADFFRGQVPLLDVTGDGGRCGSGGRFQIHEMAFDSGELTRFAADFELPCGSAGTLTAGSIRYHSTRGSLLPFDGAYPLNALRIVTTSGGYVTAPGIECGDGGRIDCDETYSVPTQVPVQAVASPGYQLVGWSGACSSGNAIATVHVDRVKRCFAVFSPAATSGAAADPSLATATLLIDEPASTPPGRSIVLGADAAVRGTTSIGGSDVSITFTSPGGAQLSVSFSAPGGARLAPGDYEEAYSSPLTSFAGFNVSNCATDVARFRIYQASFDGNGALLAFAADFEALCRFPAQPYVVGAVRFNAGRARVVPFDGAYPQFKLTIEPAVNGTVTAAGIDCGPGRADCSETYASATTVALRAAPAPGFRFVGWTGLCDGQMTTTVLVDWTRRCSAVFNAAVPGIGVEDPRVRDAALFVDSQPGDDVGEGRRHVWLDAGTIVGSSFQRNSAFLGFRAPDGEAWSIELFARGMAPLVPGVYDNAGYPFFNRTGPGIYISTFSRSCSTSLVGRFVIYEIAYDPLTGNLTSLAVDFEQRCNPGSAALIGSARYNSGRSLLRPFPPAPTAHLPGDWNGDGRQDFIWQNRANGRLAAWFLNGTVQIDNTSIVPDQVSDAGWHIVGTADANRDGQMDLYWQHQTTGALSIWYMVETIRIGTDSLTPGVVLDTAWKVRTVTDLDRDGYPDLIWQHVGNGQVAVWFMTGALLRSGELLSPGQVLDLGWKIVGAGDVDGDGTPDLFWHHSATGQLAVWFLNGRVARSGQAIVPGAVADTAWQVRGVGDLDGNGSPDLIWQNTTTFQVAVWLLNGLGLIDGRLITGPALPSADWYVVGPK
jgi:hypothetical protein